MNFPPEALTEVADLLAQRGKTQIKGESLERFVSRGLSIAPKKARAFLTALHDGNSAEDALLLIGIGGKLPVMSIHSKLARVVGSALGSIMARSRITKAAGAR